MKEEKEACKKNGGGLAEYLILESDVERKISDTIDVYDILSDLLIESYVRLSGSVEKTGSKK
ncbi:MAG: hypothetical protein A3J83_00415 [Elusimicrobia bacterium RIFOXYA2_FULL_40_6]|nr:MAG: hypothetical protein A3J83_00415 [Elusimicrobia bacterium RIFOXYA2_FULL_40_6]